MNNLNSQSTNINWVEDVYQLLMDIARSSLSDIPRLPENFSQKALPLLQKVQSIEDSHDGQGISGTSGYEREWAQQVRQFLLEITSVYLSEQPRMPENLAGRAIGLAEKAQAIKESAENESPSVNESDNSVPHPDGLLQLLRESLKIQRSKSKNPDAPQWQQAITMLDVLQGMYNQVRE
ncbi:inorganic pyrophosphatase [Oscillatoriales cyanobacterium USR001]|nr:inorganic pyrophosphatase [Oscillatoriales cyanobacterium USR001]